MVIGAGVAGFIFAFALWLVMTAKNHVPGQIRGGFNFAQFKIQELARRGLHNRTKY